MTVRRLNRVEYRNTVRDLLGVDYNTDHEFPPDDTGFGFDNIGDALTMSPMLMEKYVAAAQTIVAEAVPTAPRKPIEQIVEGMAFEGTNARIKWGKRQLAVQRAGRTSRRTFKTSLPGTYRVKFNMEVNGSYYPDPGKARIVFKIDGKEFLNQEFAYHDEKDYVFESTHKWQPAEHTAEHRAAADGAGREEGNHHRPVRAERDDRRSAREEPVGEDGKLRPLFSAPRSRTAPSSAAPTRTSC